MGVLEQLSAQDPELNLLAGTTTEGAYIDDDTLVHAGLGDTLIGRQGQPAPGWFAPFADSAERISWTADIDDALWKKLLINCAINPLTAMHRCRNGSLLDNPALRAQVELLCEELAAVSAARGSARGASCALNWALAVIQRTADNQSSMLQDVLQGRETEIRYITGYLVSEARRLGVPCPRNAALLAQLDSASLSN
jgi:2-dehydropantoate 2-reductase